MRGLVVGIGLSHRATRRELRTLLDAVLDSASVGLGSVALVATREKFVDDARLLLGPPVVGIADEQLCARYPVARRRFPALVAEGCALIAAGAGADLLVGTTRSAHATVALALAPHLVRMGT